jgi:CBS domain-containing membrane protein
VGGALRHLLARVPQAHSEKPEVVGQMMRDVRDGLLLAHKNDGVAAVAQAMASGRQPAVPVINSADRLVGTLGRADMVAALYNRIAVADATQAG